MTKAVSADNCLKHPFTYALATSSAGQGLAFRSVTSDLVCDGQKAIRSIIAAARPVMHEDASRHSKIMAARRIWGESRPVGLTPAATYLAMQGIVLDEDDNASVRFHPSVKFEATKQFMPAVITPVHDLDGQFVGIYKTYLNADGKGKPQYCGDKNRMLGNCFGFYAQLGAVASSFRLIIAESIETALQIRQACPEVPVWAAMTLGNMKSPVPPAVKEIIFHPDDDKYTPDISKKLLMDAAREHMNRQVTVLSTKSFSKSWADHNTDLHALLGKE